MAHLLLTSLYLLATEESSQDARPLVNFVKASGKGYLN